MSEPVIHVTPYEDQGFFFEVTFQGDSDSTIFFVANRDLDQLRKMARNPDKTKEQFRNELRTLVEHSGLQKKLPTELVDTFRERLRRDDQWPAGETSPR